MGRLAAPVSLLFVYLCAGATTVTGSTQTQDPLSPGADCLDYNLKVPTHCHTGHQGQGSRSSCQMQLQWRDTSPPGQPPTTTTTAAAAAPRAQTTTSTSTSASTGTGTANSSVQQAVGGGRVNFSLTAVVERNHSVWAAVGFSASTTARGEGSGRHVLACIMDDNGDPFVHSVQIGSPRMEGDVDTSLQETSDGLLLQSAVISKGRLHCNFSQLKVAGNSGHSLNQEWFIHLGSGLLFPSDNGFGEKVKLDGEWIVSAEKCDVLDCSKQCMMYSAFNYKLLQIHGIAMCFAFMVLFSTGALVSRYFKRAFNESWFKIHTFLMLAGVLFVALGLAFVLWDQKGEFEVGLHQLCGVVCIGFVFFQPVLGFLRPPVGTTLRRRVFNCLHRLTAVIILTLGYVTLFLGAILLHNAVYRWLLGTLALSSLTNLTFTLLLECITRANRDVLPPVGYHKVSKVDSDSDDVEVFVRDKEDSNTYSLKTYPSSNTTDAATPSPPPPPPSSRYPRTNATARARSSHSRFRSSRTSVPNPFWKEKSLLTFHVLCAFSLGAFAGATIFYYS